MSQNSRSCIFSLYCSNEYCDMSCVRNAVSQILLEKSGLDISDSAFTSDYTEFDECEKFIESHDGKISVIECKKPLNKANLFTYVSICNMCEGHGSSVTVFHLKFNQYLNSIRDSWSSGISSKLREQQAFISSSRILIISGLDYCNLKDFECQTMLGILQDRSKSSLTTIIVLSDVRSLSGSGSFIVPLKDQLKEVLVND